MDKPKLTVVETIPTADQVEIRSAVDILERALADAREGNILACAIALVGSNQKVGYMSSESSRHATQLIASVGLMHFRLCSNCWEELGMGTEEFPDPPSEPAA